MTREEMFRKLSELDGSLAAVHEEAEQILLEYIDDDDLKAVWDDFAEEWWYS